MQILQLNMWKCFKDVQQADHLAPEASIIFMAAIGIFEVIWKQKLYLSSNGHIR